MSWKVLFFFPHNPYPPQTGAHKRCLEMIAGLKEIGCRITLLSSTLSSKTEWTTSSIESLKTDWVRDVRVYEATILDYRFIALLRRFYWLVKRNSPVNSALYSPPGMRRWFRRMLHEISPDIVLLNYAYWDGLLDHQKFRSVLQIIDTYDLATLNLQMRQALEKYLPSPPISADDVEDEVLKEDFFEKLGLTAYSEEFRIYDRYDYTLAISPKEADMIRQNTHNTKVLLIPMTQQLCHIPNRYTGPALFPTGPNPFNIQGYLYLIKRVLPQVRRRAPSFSLQVTGYCCKYVSPKESVVLSGFVPNLKTVYESARFSVCPVFGGTGQQIKIFEAMSHGVPVVALRAAAEGSPIRHGVNGFVANNADEFACYVNELWNNQELCRQLGGAARDTIAIEFSRSRLIEELSSIVNSQNKSLEIY